MPKQQSGNSSLNNGSQYAELINGLKAQGKEVPVVQDSKQVTGKKKSSLYKKGQSDIGVTQLLISHQEGVNVIPPEQDEINPKMHVSIQEKPLVTQTNDLVS